MKLPVAIAPPALEELRQAMEWHEARRPGLGDELLDEVVKALRHGVTLAPAESWTRSKSLGVRRILVPRFHYALILDPEHPDGLTIVAVVHQKQRPGYWRERLAPTSRSRPRRPKR